MIVYDKNIFGSNREIDSNGYLRVDSCNITKTQVAPYLGREIPNWKDMGLEAEKIYYVLRPEDELRKAVPTFNNLPLTREHIEVDVENVPKDKIVGSLGDHAEYADGYLKNNLIVYDQKDIDLIMSGKKKELSCGYRYTPVREHGTFNGQDYDFIMKDIVGNHVALVKEGRAGHDVVVSDTISKVKEKFMRWFRKSEVVYDNKEEITDDKKLDSAQQEKVGVVMKEFKEGELESGSGKKVTDPKQAIAIALSEAKETRDEKEIPDEQEKPRKAGEENALVKGEEEMTEEVKEALAKEKVEESFDEKTIDDIVAMDELAQDSWGEETEYNGQKGHYLTTKSGHHIFIPNGTTTKEAISKHFDELRSQKQKELGENPWRDKYSYEEAKRGLERAKSSIGLSLGKAAAADFDKMISELESKRAISEAKMKEYDDKLHEIYEECSKALKEAETESNEGKPESKIKEETEYEDIEFKAPRQREKVEKSGHFESDWENPEHIDIGVPDTDNVSYDILDSVMGQMSDGMWENSRAVEKYWRNANISKKDGTIGIKVNTGWRSPYGEMGDEEIREYFAKKIKAVAKEELGGSNGGWNRDNETELDYLSRGNRKPVRVKDAYKLYDHLLGRSKK